MSSIASAGGTPIDNIVHDDEADSTGEESYTVESRFDAHLEAVGGELILMPSDKIDRSISAIFKRYLHPTGFAWKMIPIDKRMFYRTEFKKECRWACADDEVLPVFLKKCGERYTNLLYHMKMDYLAETKPEYVKDEDWPGWIAYWQTEPTQEKSNSRESPSSSEEGLVYTQEELDARLEMQAKMYEERITQMEEMHDYMLQEIETRMEAKLDGMMEKQVKSSFERLLRSQSGSRGEGSKGHDGGSS